VTVGMDVASGVKFWVGVSSIEISMNSVVAVMKIGVSVGKALTVAAISSSDIGRSMNRPMIAIPKKDKLTNKKAFRNLFKEVLFFAILT
jgi:hypothetical protein